MDREGIEGISHDPGVFDILLGSGWLGGVKVPDTPMVRIGVVQKRIFIV